MAIPNLETTYTYDDYLTWPVTERWELIHGMPYAMSPAPSRAHQGILFALTVQVGQYLQGKPCRAYPAPFDVRFVNGDGITDTVVQPDLSIICDPAKLDAAGCIGAPDVVFEILAPSTAVKDLTVKLPLYEAHGVKEYWVVDPHDTVVMVFNLSSLAQYGRPRIFAPDAKAESLVMQGLVIDLVPVFSE